MAVALTYSGLHTVVENLTGNVADVSAANNTLQHDQFNKTVALNVSSNPAISLYAGFVATLVSGALTIDLTALTGTNGLAVNGNGLKVQSIVLQAPAANANPITFGKGATNGYTGLGATFFVSLSAGAQMIFYLAGGGVAISGTVKTFDLTGTGAQTLNVGITMG